MSIVLLILKIIGIFLLVVLGMGLFVFLSLTFVPVRYQVFGRIEEEIEISVGVSWFLHLISFRIKYSPKDQEQTLRIFGIPLRLFGKEEDKKKSKKRKKRKNKKQKRTEKQSQEPPVLKEPEKTLEEERGLPSEPAAFPEPKEQKESGPSFFEKIRKIPRMIRNKWETLTETIKGFWEKLGRLKGQAGRIREELGREENRQAVKALLREAKRLFGHMLPRKLQGELSFGTTDPAITGQILGVISTIPFLYRYQIQVTPDFSSESYYIRGTFRLKGHARGIHAVITCFSLFRDKNIRKIIQRYRHS